MSRNKRFNVKIDRSITPYRKEILRISRIKADLHENIYWKRYFQLIFVISNVLISLILYYQNVCSFIINFIVEI